MTKYFDFSTVYTAILTCNLLLAIIAVIIRNEKIMVNVGYKLITIFLEVTAVRFMLPIQVSFVTTIPFSNGISRIIAQIFTPLFKVHGFKVIPLHFILIIWIAGIFIQGYRYYQTNRKIYAYIFTHGKNVSKDPRYAALMSGICGESAPKYRIYEMPHLQTPLLYGFRIPYILLPQNYICSGNELTYILKHEVMHYKHHDLMIKFLVRLLSIIYWWNPFCYLLNNQIDLVLEMRIDDTVSGLSNKEISEYLHSLLNLAEFQDTVLSQPLGNVISFAHGNKKVLTKRFHMLMHRKNKKNKVLNLLLIFVFGVIYLCSYLFIFESYYVSSEESEISLQFSEINSFLLDNGDGTYDLYYDNYKIETLDSLDYYSDDIPVYTREEFERVQQENLE